MTYRFYYKEIELGTITRVDEDFPNLFGIFKQLDLDNSNAAKLIEYIQYSIQESKENFLNETMLQNNTTD